MKKLFLLLAILIAVPSFAQYKPDELVKKGAKIVYPNNDNPSNANIYSILGEEEYARYQSGRSLTYWGLGVGGAGLVIGIGGGIIGNNAIEKAYAAGDSSAAHTYESQRNALIGVGCGAVITGVVLYFVGNGKIKNVVERYNLRASVSGVGLSMSF